MAVSGFETGYKSLDSHVKQMYCKKKKKLKKFLNQ